MINRKLKLKSIIGITALCCAFNAEMNATKLIYQGSRIEANQFANNVQYTEIECPYVTFIGNDAFANSTIERITLADNQIINLASGAFRNANRLQYANLGNTHVIPTECFKNCTALKIVNSDNATHILANAFNNCLQLNFFSFSPYIQSIDNNVLPSRPIFQPRFAMPIEIRLSLIEMIYNKLGRYSLNNIQACYMYYTGGIFPMWLIGFHEYENNQNYSDDSNYSDNYSEFSMEE